MPQPNVSFAAQQSRLGRYEPLNQVDRSTVDLKTAISESFAQCPPSSDRDSHACHLTEPPIAFQAEWPPCMNFASKPRSRSLIAVLHPTWKP